MIGIRKLYLKVYFKKLFNQFILLSSTGSFSLPKPFSAMAEDSNPTPLLDEEPPNPQDTIQIYLLELLKKPEPTGTVSLFNPSPSPPTAWPRLHPYKTNQILLYPGSFNPPHIGHLATVHHFYKRREQLNIVAFFTFADPSPVIESKNKKHGSIILPRSLRNEIFYRTPELHHLISSGWLHLLVGSMESHIAFL